MLPACIADLRIVIGEVPLTLQSSSTEGVLWQATSKELLLEFPDTARLLVSSDEIVVAPLAADAFDRIGPFLRRAPLMAVMLLRGAFACNGAAVVGPDGAVLLLGVTVAGKSTLAAALMKRGLRLMADDAAPIVLDASGRATIAPVWPELMLWSDATAKVFPSGTPDWLARRSPVPPEAPYWDIGRDRFCPQPARLKAAYRIGRNALSETIGSTAHKGISALLHGALMPHHGRMAAALADHAAVLRIYGAVTAACTIQEIKLPYLGVGELEDLADRIMQDCEWPISI